MFRIKYYEVISTKNVKNVKKKKKIFKRKVKCLNTTERVLRVSSTNPTSRNINFFTFNKKFEVFMLKNTKSGFLETQQTNSYFLKKNVVYGDISNIAKFHTNNSSTRFCFDIVFFFLKFKNSFI
jgi:hypothetical protein